MKEKLFEISFHLLGVFRITTLLFRRIIKKKQWKSLKALIKNYFLRFGILWVLIKMLFLVQFPD